MSFVVCYRVRQETNTGLSRFVSIATELARVEDMQSTSAGWKQNLPRRNKRSLFRPA